MESHQNLCRKKTTIPAQNSICSWSTKPMIPFYSGLYLLSIDLKDGTYYISMWHARVELLLLQELLRFWKYKFWGHSMHYWIDFPAHCSSHSVLLYLSGQHLPSFLPSSMTLSSIVHGIYGPWWFSLTLDSAFRKKKINCTAPLLSCSGHHIPPVMWYNNLILHNCILCHPLQNINSIKAGVPNFWSSISIVESPEFYDSQT